MDRSSQHLPQHLQVTIKRVDADLPLPTYATEGSVGFDLLGDELMVQVFNFREEAVTVKRGERIAQGIFVPVLRVSWNEVDEMGKGRGGFGSTGA